MSAAKMALEALEAAGKAATPRPLSTIDVGYVAACRHDGQHLYAATHTAYNADVRYAVAAVNLAALLAAVARAAMHWRNVFESPQGVRTARQRRRYSSDVGAARNQVFAALDALEAAAREVTP